jgi:endo-1,4-beta-xylanase
MKRTSWLAVSWPIFFLLARAVPVAPQTLRSTADGAGILIGAAVRPSLFSEPAYAQTLSREFNMVEAEDAMKWQVIRRNRDEFDFREADEVVRFAEAHGMRVRGHCLVWDHDNPAWLAQGNYTSAELSRRLHEHISTVVAHFAGRVFAWDVVNEALDENGRFRDSPWYNHPGIGLSANGAAYVEHAFRWAHDADPHALLFYNDNGAEGTNSKSDAVYGMVKDFRQRGVPIDGVGLQLHISNLEFDAQGVNANIARLCALGLQVHITELDVALPLNSGGGVNDLDAQRQAEIYRDVARVCLANRGCTAIQIWGFTDKYSWIGSHSKGTHGAALLFDRTYKPKPSHAALLDEISNPKLAR